jgi:hypothetical protein
MTALQSESITKLAAALVKAQASMGVALKDAVNPHFRSKYADLPSVVNAAREPLAANGLAVVQRSHPHERGVLLQTTILHESGEWISDEGLLLPAAKVDPQGFGSAMTYARRYGYAAMLGIVQDDDDGAAAVKQLHAARAKPVGKPLTHEQAAVLTLIARAARPDRQPDLTGKLAEDYEQHVRAFVKFAAKEGAIGKDAAEDVVNAALALDVQRVNQTLQAVPA